MKLAMIGHKDFPSRSGGVEVVVYELATRLVGKGEIITVSGKVWSTAVRRLYKRAVLMQCCIL